MMWHLKLSSSWMEVSEQYSCQDSSILGWILTKNTNEPLYNVFFNLKSSQIALTSGVIALNLG
jgi:hypothetical protein